MKTPKDLKSVSQAKHGPHSRIFSHGHRDSLLFSHSLILGAFGEIAKSFFRLIHSEVEHWDQLYEDITVHFNNSIRSIQIMVGCISCIAKWRQPYLPP